MAPRRIAGGLPAALALLLASMVPAVALELKCRSVHRAVWDEVIAACTAELQSGRLSNEERALALRNRGVGYFVKKDYNRAITDIDALFLLEPQKNVLNYYSRGNIYYFMGDMERAIRDYDEVIKLAPDYRDVKANRDRALAKKP